MTNKKAQEAQTTAQATQTIGLSALIEALEGQTAQTLDDLDKMEDIKLWTGVKNVHLISADADDSNPKFPNAWRVVFADSKGEPMPSQYEGRHGDLWFSTPQALKKWLKDMRYACHMRADMTTAEIVEELMKPHYIAFTIKSSFGANGLNVRNIVDFMATFNNNNSEQ